MALLAAGIFGLFLLQSVFVNLRATAPEVAALHPVNGFLITLLAIVLARDAWIARRAAQTA
jgi:cytochrome b561